MNESTTKKLMRSRDDRVIGGVASGIAQYLGIDPLLVRVAFVASLAFGGLGILIYLLMLLFAPMDGESDQPLAPISDSRRYWALGTVIAGGAIAMLAVLVGGFDNWLFGFAPGVLFGVLFWTAMGCLLIWVLANGAFDRGRKAPAEVGDRPVSTASTFAEAPTQIEVDPATERTEVMERTDGEDQVTTVIDTGTEPSPAPPRQGRSAGEIIVQVLFWSAVAVTVLVVASVLGVLSAAATVVAGALPMAVLTVFLGVGLAFAAVRGRRAASVLLFIAAAAVSLPMVLVSLADLRVEGSYGDLHEQPRRSADIPADGYRMAAGNLVVDLRTLDFSGRKPLDLTVRSGMGITSVIVPNNVCVSGTVTGKAGVTTMRGNERSGVNVKGTAPGFIPPKGGGFKDERSPQLNLDAEFKLGAFELVDATTWKRYGQGGSLNHDNRDSAYRARQRAERACTTIGSDKPGALRRASLGQS